MPHELLDRARALAGAWLDALPDRHVGPAADDAALRAALDRPLTDAGEDPATVLEDLARDVEPGLVASGGPRYHGFVIGGALPVAMAADWLVSAYDQPAVLHASSPGMAVLEDIAGTWALDVLRLPAGSGVGFVTGAQMANATCLATARNAVLAREGWDARADGLSGAPAVEVLVGDEVHVTVGRALGLIGMGERRVTRVAVDAGGAMDPAALARALDAGSGPSIVCAQAGNVNTGACDPLAAIADACAARGAWLHVDGAFGLWAASAPELAHLVAGHDRADSWAVDCHKWLNVPYDSALAIVRDAAAQARAMGMTAAYLAGSDEREPNAFVPESSRRARAVPVYAALRTLGRDGVAALVDRCCAQARLMARLLAEGGVEVLNDVVLNQVLAGFGDARGVVARVQADGTCWLGGTTWRGRDAMRISFSNWSTTDDDVRASAAAILRAAR
ncbi:aspartate aminotransferase family protein [Baekduia soli]|uniref:Aspartate aminotransferase family protein n=1 Tax=Baekduia soli TaxID=496014 RepID=A0A5B8U3B2_9ACTN|nr:pyridoxal-dependent decarboxylase [Baekduia soli]QEC47547.1 aspartate aminotransferase family protein [Baekduia soli]